MQNYQIWVPKKKILSHNAIFLTLALKKTFEENFSPIFTCNASISHTTSNLLLRATCIQRKKKTNKHLYSLHICINVLYAITCRDRYMQGDAMHYHCIGKVYMKTKSQIINYLFFFCLFCFLRDEKRRKKTVYFSRLYQLLNYQIFFKIISKLIKN